jgi:predicted nucleic acid-binding protein
LGTQGASTRVVHAATYDIRKDVTPPQRLLVDTNVWLYLAYGPFSLGDQAALAAPYVDFVAKCIEHGCQLLRSPLSVPEIAHVIERNEAKASSAHGNNQGKQMRWIPNSRRKVIAEVLNTWKQITATSEWSEGLKVDGAAGDEALLNFRNLKVDGYDLFLVQEALTSGNLAVLTNDFDFLSVPTLTVYTANDAGVEAARRSNRLRS